MPENVPISRRHALNKSKRSPRLSIRIDTIPSLFEHVGRVAISNKRHNQFNCDVRREKEATLAAKSARFNEQGPLLQQENAIFPYALPRRQSWRTAFAGEFLKHVRVHDALASWLDRSISISTRVPPRSFIVADNAAEHNVISDTIGVAQFSAR